MGYCIDIGGEGGGALGPSNWYNITRVGRGQYIWGISVRWGPGSSVGIGGPGSSVGIGGPGSSVGIGGPGS